MQSSLFFLAFPKVSESYFNYKKIYVDEKKIDYLVMSLKTQKKCWAKSLEPWSINDADVLKKSCSKVC